MSHHEAERGPSALRGRLRSLLWVFTIATWVLLSPRRAVASPDPWFDDARFQGWAQTYLTGRVNDVVASLEKDLKSPKPHPLAAHIYCSIESERGRLEDDLAKADPALLSALGSLPKILAMSDPQARLDAFPPAAAAHENIGTLLALISAAEDDVYDYRLAFEYSKLLQARAPGQFVGLYYGFNAEIANVPGDDDLASKMTTWFSQGSAAGTSAAKFANSSLATRGFTSAERLAQIDAFLADRPSDWWAVRYRAFALTTLGRTTLAAKEWERAFRLAPFLVGPGRAATEYIRLGDEATARKLLSEEANINAIPPLERDDWIAARLAKAARTAGEPSRSRELAESVLRDHPDHWAALAELAELDSSGGRPDLAVSPAEKVFKKSQSNADLERWLRALRNDGRPEKVWAVYQKLEPRNRADWDVTWHASQALAVLGQHNDRVTILQAANARYHGAPWIKSSLADALYDLGRKDDARKLLIECAAVDPSSHSAKLRRWTAELQGDDAAKKELEATRVRAPWARGVWSELAALVKGKDKSSVDARLAIWRAAKQANPRKLWPIDSETIEFMNAERWDEAEQVGRAVLTGRTSLSPGEDVMGLEQLPWIMKQRALGGPVSPKLVDDSFAALDELHRIIGDTAAEHQYRAQGYLAKGDRVRAAEEGLAWSRLAPDAIDPIWFLANTLGDVAGPRMWQAAARYLARDDHSGERLRHLVQLHTLYGGSPVVALYYIHLTRERAPKQDLADLEGIAYGHLGDSSARMSQYLRTRALSPSDRYIGWYNKTRENAMNDPTAVGLPFVAASQARCPTEFATPRVSKQGTAWAVVCSPDGTVLIREDDLVTGKAVQRAHGAAFVRYRYDSKGQLINISASSGDQIDLTYDAAGHITRIAPTHEGALTFVNNAAGKPTKISVQGVGDINVEYDPQSGEITKTESPNGRAVVNKVWEAMSSLQRMTEAAQGNAPEIPHKDPSLDALRAARARAGGVDWEVALLHDERMRRSAGEVRRSSRESLALASYLVDHVQDDPSHAYEAEDITNEIFIVLGTSPADEGAVVEALTTWYRLKLATRPAGLSSFDLEALHARSAWLDRTKGFTAKRLIQLMKDKPLDLMKNARWLARADISAPGVWRRHATSRVLPAPVRGAELKAVLLRANGDQVVGTSRGLAVLRRGFWEWFAFDDSRGRLSATVAPEALTGSSDINALAEGPTGELVIGTSAGLLVIAGDYGDAPKRFHSPEEGLPVPSIESLASSSNWVYVATASGLRLLADEKLSPVKGYESTPIAKVRPAPEGAVLVVTAMGLSIVGPQSTVALTTSVVSDAVLDPATNQVIYLSGRTLYGVPITGGVAPRALPDQANIVAQKGVTSLGLMPIDRYGAPAVVALTDQGLSIFHQSHFEHLALPSAEKRPAVFAIHSAAGNALAATSDGVYALELGRTHVNEGPVRALLTIPREAMTLVVRDFGLYAILDGDPSGQEQIVDNIAVTAVAPNPKGGWVANDGSRILQYDPEVGAPAEVFVAEPSAPPPDEIFQTGPVSSLLVASDGAIWAVAGSYVYRYKDGKKEEFSTAINADVFPARSEMLSRVFETVDHKIWVVASDEGHLEWRGTKLRGGIVEWDGTKFTRTNIPDNTNGWFLRSYTPIDEYTAVAGTTSGFARERGGRVELYDSIGDSTYKAVAKDHPQLWLGTQGARVGSVWLFGTAGGVVALKDGAWFVPDRLNWLLPGQGLASYGSRHVNAVAASSTGRVFVGTDLGLLVYDSGGGDASGFLVTNEREIDAFGDSDLRVLEGEADSLLRGVSPDSAIGKRIARVNALKKEVEALKADLGFEKVDKLTGQRVPPVTDAGQKAEAKLEPTDETKVTALRAKEKELNNLFLQLEQSDPGLYQLLELKPIDLSAVRSRLRDDAIVVQYLPTDKRLFIQLVSKQGREVKEVDVSRAELMQRALKASVRLGKLSDEGQLRGVFVAKLATANQPPLDDELAWLYGQLLAPIEGDLAGRAYVYIVPVGELTYLPFGALIRKKEPTVEYAVERFTFGYVTSLYMLELMGHNVPSNEKGALVLADPDGSLPGARTEASAIVSAVAGARAKVGSDATYDSLVSESPKAPILHLATHGYLDHLHPEQSYVLLANNVRLSVPDAMTLNLKSTDLVVLSACETGVGRSGLEYGTLARAFMTAGTSTVVATLWQVDDDASVALIKAFYGALASGDDRLTALTKAQRAMLRDSHTGRHAPSKWSGYVAFGRP